MVEYEITRKKDTGELDIPCVILDADSPATVAALIAYADAAERLGDATEEVALARAKAKEFEEWRTTHLARPSDPQSPPAPGS